MKKILSIILVSLLFSPLFVFADWCSTVGGEWHDNANGMDTCYCMENGTIKSAASAGSNCNESEEDWCTAGGGVFCTNGGHMNCYCSNGSVMAGSSCDSGGSFSCSSLNLTTPGGGTTTTGGSGGTTTTGGGTTTTGDSTGLTSSTGGISNPINANSFAELVELVTKWIIDIALVLAPLIIVYGGFIYITAAGEPAKMETGKKIILYAVIGFILVLLATSLVDVLTDLAK
ncbi:pilin [bacterium]|nr:pilin [bacterium]